MKIFYLKGKECLVDDEDYIIIKDRAISFDTSGYLRFSGDRISLHRFVLGANKLPRGIEIDHINRNKLDNRKENLRICTRQQNLMNYGVRADNKTGYKGVQFLSKSNKYRAVINFNKKRIHVGYFKNKDSAAEAYNTMADKLHGKFAFINIINKKAETEASA